jgi:hypothetical protein
VVRGPVRVGRDLESAAPFALEPDAPLRRSCCPVSIDPGHAQAVSCGGSDGVRRDRCAVSLIVSHLVTVQARGRASGFPPEDAGGGPDEVGVDGDLDGAVTGRLSGQPGLMSSTQARARCQVPGGELAQPLLAAIKGAGTAAGTGLAGLRRAMTASPCRDVAKSQLGAPGNAVAGAAVAGRAPSGGGDGAHEALRRRAAPPSWGFFWREAVLCGGQALADPVLR